MGYYTGDVDGAIGIFPSPYYWWEAGAVWGAMIDYWYLTGDDQYNDVVSEALLFQVGPNADYMPPNQTRTLWLALAQAVFNSQAPRWDTSTCGGGLKWQIFAFNNGYNYKNAISTGTFFQLAARLYQYTGNQTYADWATTAYEWATDVGLINAEYHVFDGTDDTTNCTEINHIQWSANAGLFIYGSAVMYNMTSSPTWRTRTDSLLSANLRIFTYSGEGHNPGGTPGVIYEPACESNGMCNIDQLAFRGLFARWLSRTALAAPFTADAIFPVLGVSAEAAAEVCNPECGARWYRPGDDGERGLSTQLSALEVIQANLVGQARGSANGNSTTGASGNGTGMAPNGTQGTASGTRAPIATQSTNAAPGTAVCGAVAAVIVAGLAVAGLL
ncbi:hydrolase 76 protein [Coniosporium tulheliwenetii]|uniref:Hydrolase 76 protein n=1 Tax=Coniosporium tulheliwenetii TaxID=3383036 RepID=A0ACC2Z5C1_9PEZI|nr:hydrolase 76 protein [Cladosporium sp. JES 115]